MYNVRALVGIASEAVQRSYDFLVPRPIQNLPGYTSLLQRAFLMALCRRGLELRYLEVGVFQGASLISAGQGAGWVVGIENFAEGQHDALYHNLRSIPMWSRFDIIEGDVMHPSVGSKLAALGEGGLSPVSLPFDVLFFDANTSHSALGDALQYLYRCLGDNFIWIVDNWSDPVTRHRFGHLLEAYRWSTYATWQLMPEVDCDIDGWGNGWLVAVVQKKPLSRTQWYELRGKGPALWDVMERRRQGLRTINDYRVRGL